MVKKDVHKKVRFMEKKVKFLLAGFDLGTSCIQIGCTATLPKYTL